MQSADCILSPMQSADCAGSQIACNIYTERERSRLVHLIVRLSACFQRSPRLEMNGCAISFEYRNAHV